MLKGIDINQRIEFISNEDMNEPKTVFVLKPMTAADELGLAKFVVDGKANLSGDYIYYLLEKSVVEIKNPEAKDKDAILSYMDTLPLTVLMEIATEIGRIKNLQETDIKN